MTKDELFEIFDKYDTYEFIKEGESIHSIKWADLNGLADELVKLFAIPVSVCDECEDGSGWYGDEDITMNCSLCNPKAC